MSDREFLDTNVLVYAFDVADRRKHEIAQALTVRALAGESAISAQVLSELSAILLQKYRATYDARAVLAILDSLRPIPLIVPDAAMVRRAVEAYAAYGIHFYDGMIVAAAERGRCGEIFSEDLNAGQEYFGVSVVNPFVA
jgi:predicted nucleic acid-binding protein